MNRQDYLFVGVDLHKEKHVAVLANCWSEVIGSFVTDNAPAKFPKFLRDIKKKAKGKPVIFGLEDVTFYGRSLAKFLLDEGQIVKAVNSAYTKRERNRSTAPDKTDTKDAEAICETLIRKLPQLPDANPQDIYWVLKQLLANYEYLNKMATGVKNSLQNQLIHHYPTYNKLFKDIDGKTALAFYEKFPSPDKLMNETVDNLGAFLRKHSNNAFSTKKAESILNEVNNSGWRQAGFQRERDSLIKSYIRTLKSLQEEMREMEKQMGELIKQSGYKLETMPGLGTVTAATIIAGIGDISRYPSADKIAKVSGIAPLNKSSGKNLRQTRNRYGNRRLNYAFYILALNHIQVDKKKNPRNPVMYQYYLKKQQEGRSGKQAMVYVMRRLVNIVYSMMKHKTEYRPPVQLQKVEGEASRASP